MTRCVRCREVTTLADRRVLCPECVLAVDGVDAPTLLLAVDRLAAGWDRLCRCVDEFEPEDMGACEERRQDVYGAIERVVLARRGK